MPPTELQRTQAALLDRDRAGLEKIGIEAARRIGQRTRLAALRAFKRGDDPLQPAREQLATMRDLLTDAMVAAYLKGLRRVELTVQRQQKIKLSTAYDGVIEHLRKQALLRPEDLDELRVRFGNDVAKVLGELTNAVDGRLMNTMTDLTIRQAHVAEGIADLKEAFHRSGIDPANSYTLENIFRTQTQIAYSAGRWQALEDPAIDEILWGFTYVSVGDNRVRPNHVAMDGIRLPKDDPFWSRFFPPNGYSCRCAAIEIFEGDSLARRSRIVTPKPKRVDGATVYPDADPGFDFNPGQLFSGAQKPKPVPTTPPLVLPEPNPVPKIKPTPTIKPPRRKPRPQPKAPLPPSRPAPAKVPTPSPKKKVATSPAKPVKPKKPVAVPPPAAPSKAVVKLQSPKNLTKYDRKNRFNKATNASMEAAVNDAMESINAIHGVPVDMKSLSVKANGKSVLGEYVYGETTKAPFEFRLTTKGPHPRMTMMHEMGHYLDHHGIGTKGQFESSSGKQAKTVMAKLKKSNAYEKLTKDRQQYLRKGNKEMVRHLDYLMEDEELFARSYSQYIASKSSDRTIKNELQQMQKDTFLSTQWSDEDYKPIMDEMDKMFSDLGWAR